MTEASILFRQPRKAYASWSKLPFYDSASASNSTANSTSSYEVLRASDETKKIGGGKLRCQKITMAKDDALPFNDIFATKWEPVTCLITHCY